jgi:hypothetical protein
VSRARNDPPCPRVAAERPLFNSSKIFLPRRQASCASPAGGGDADVAKSENQNIEVQVRFNVIPYRDFAHHHERAQHRGEAPAVQQQLEPQLVHLVWWTMTNIISSCCAERGRYAAKSSSSARYEAHFDPVDSWIFIFHHLSRKWTHPTL